MNEAHSFRLALQEPRKKITNTEYTRDSIKKYETSEHNQIQEIRNKENGDDIKLINTSTNGN